MTDNKAELFELSALVQRQAEVIESLATKKVAAQPGIEHNLDIAAQAIVETWNVTRTLLLFALDRDDIEPEWAEVLKGIKDASDDLSENLRVIFAPNMAAND